MKFCILTFTYANVLRMDEMREYIPVCKYVCGHEYRTSLIAQTPHGWLLPLRLGDVRTQARLRA